MSVSPKRVEPGLSPGYVLWDKYRVDEILGKGAVGVVARCMHLQLNETVAIKMLRKEMLEDRDTVERFTREARAAAKLRSEHVARVSDVGTFGDGAPYIVMEFLNGQDLGQLIAEKRTFAVPQVAQLMLQAAEALAEAHSIGIVHRDVKTSNLFVTKRPDGGLLLKVLDFGISKAPIGAELDLAQTQSLLGTPAYMSPEQTRSAHTVDARSDVWSLGVVMYELVEGRRPFGGASFSEMCFKVAVDPPTPMTKMPPGLRTVVLRCLEKAPEDRYANMAELGRALAPYAADPHQAAALVTRMERVLERRPAVDWTSGVTPQLEKPNLDTVPREPTIERVDYAVDEATDDLIAATARPRWRSMLLYGLAAMAAVIIGVIPALWINRRRADETALALPEPARASSVSSPAALANPPSIAGPAEPSLAAELPATASAEPPPAREPAPAAAARPETAAGKGGKPSRPHSVKPAAKPAAPANKHKQAETAPCDVYLHPHGCPH